MIQPFHVYLYGSGGGPLSVSFEDAAGRLQNLPKLGFEWDGSFVWAVGPTVRGAAAQQIFGMLYDAAGQVQYCEIQGRCSLDTWQTLCQSLLGRPANGRANVEGDAGDVSDLLSVMRLPESKWQNLQSFEQSVWQLDDQSSRQSLDVKES